MSKRVVLTHSQFYQACEGLKKHRAAFLDGRPSYQEAGKMLSQLVGFEVSDRAIRIVSESTGVTWIAKRPRLSAKARDELRTLATALHRLYRKLGEEIPNALEGAVPALPAERSRCFRQRQSRKAE